MAEKENIVEHGAMQMENPGWGDQYPKLLYRDGGSGEDHFHIDARLKIAGKFECETKVVESASEEAEALDDGWRTSPDPEIEKKAEAKRNELTAANARIAELEAQIASRPRVGRPPKGEGAADDGVSLGEGN